MKEDMRLANSRRLFEYHCYEGEDSADAELWHHTHQKVIVLRKLKNIEEIDEADTGRMYKVRFQDGFEAHVTDDELVRDHLEFYMPDYKRN